MSTNLLLGYPELLHFDASDVSCDKTAATGYEEPYIVNGQRHTYYWEAAASSATATFTITSPSEVSINYAFFANANFLLSQGATKLEITNDADGVVMSQDPLSSATFVGPRSEDLILTATASTADDAHYIKIYRSTSFRLQVGKVYLGTLFDFGHDPIRGAGLNISQESAFNRSPILRFDLTWVGITAAKITTFINYFVRYADINNVLLYDQSDVLFAGYTCLFCRLVNHVITPRSVNNYDITATFEEAI